MSGMSVTDLKRDIVMPTLVILQTPGGTDAVCQVTGTALAESGLIELKQLNGGPALGRWQMEPGTEQSIWHDYLSYHTDLAARVRSLLAPGPTTPQLVSNLAYGAAMCRIKYLWSPQRVQSTAAGMSAWHKSWYNTRLGAADAATNEPLFAEAIAA